MGATHLARVPFIEQMQQTECGLCCLAMGRGRQIACLFLHVE